MNPCPDGILSPVKLPQQPRFWIVLCFHFLLLTGPLFFTWVNEELFEFNKLLLVYGVTAAIAGLWSADMVLQQKVILKRTPIDWAVLLLLASHMVSTLLSIHPRTSIFGYYTRWHGGLLSIISYVMLHYAFVTYVTRRHLKGLLITVLVSLSLVSLYGFGEHFGVSMSCGLINSHIFLQESGGVGWHGLPQLVLAWFMQPSSFFNVSCWIQDVQHRVFASFGQPNWLAAYLVTLLPLAATSTLAQQKVPKTWSRAWLMNQALPLAVGLLAVSTLLFTGSRSGFLGLVAGVAVLGAAGTIGWWRRQASTSRRPAASPRIRTAGTWLVGAALLLTIWGSPFSPAITELLRSNGATGTPQAASTAETTAGSSSIEMGGTDSGAIRAIVWQGAIAVWQRYPLFGSGLETFAYSYYQDRPAAHNLVSEWDFLYNKAHNEFLNFLATTGVVGLLAYLAFLGNIAAMAAARIWDQNTPVTDSWWASGILAGLAGLSVTNFFGFSTVMVSVLLFLMPAVLVVLGKTETTKSQAQQTQRLYAQTWSSLKLSQLVSLGLVVLMTGFWWFSTWKTWRADHLFYQAQHLVDQGDYLSSLPLFGTAISLSPQEAVYYQHLATTYAQLAVEVAAAGQPEAAQEAADAAIATIDWAVKLNPVHLNILKAEARAYILLSQIDPQYLESANAALQRAAVLAPTDPKLLYNQALIAADQDRPDVARQLLTQAIELKPNYEAARMQLAELLAADHQTDAALEQYHYVLDFIAPNNSVARDKIASLSSKSNQRLK